VTVGTVAVTGAGGFVGRNLCVRLAELGIAVVPITRDTDNAGWADALGRADAVVHLAAANRPDDTADFMRVNAGTADLLATTLTSRGRSIPVLYSSTSRAEEPTEYGRSKMAAETVLADAATALGAPLWIYRLPNVFGKWARPNYNSAVATFCHNVARGLPITVNDPDAPLTLVYIDDVVDEFVVTLRRLPPAGRRIVTPEYATTVGTVADAIRGFRDDRDSNLIAGVGTGLTRALYATYVSALPESSFSYPVTSHRDARGAFSEMLKTRTSGQFSYFTAHPGVTRGGHYHHTKTEKFLIVHGRARFRFRHILTGERHEILTSGDEPVVVETIPGWSHDVTNVGEDVLVSLLWANELFDRERPDTVAAEVL